MMFLARNHGVGNVLAGLMAADIVVNVDWPSDRPGYDPGWSWETLPDLVGPTVIPVGGYKSQVPGSQLPGWLASQNAVNPGGTGTDQPVSGSGGPFTTSGGIDIGIPGFGLGPTMNIPFEGRDAMSKIFNAALLIGALVLGVVVVGQIRK